MDHGQGLKSGLGLLAGGVFLFLASASWGATVRSVEYRNTPSGGEVLIRAESEIDYESEANELDRQIVLSLKDAELSTAARRQLDTSGFDGPVLQVSPYQVADGEAGARVVIQLRKNVVPEISRDGGLIRIAIPRSGSERVAANEELLEAPGEPSIGQSNLGTFMETMQSKRFSGKPVTIQVRDAELSDVLRLIAEASGFNILVGDGVGGKITLSLVDVPWDQALDVILSSKRLGAERRNSILRVATLANLTAEKEEELRAKRASEKAAPRITRVFPISYADAPALQTLLQSFSNASAAPEGGAGAAAGVGASIQIDQRTNSLIVQDTAAGLAKIARLITLLDTETPQVLIEAKIVEASEDFSKNLSGQLGISTISGGRGIFGSFAGGEAVGALNTAAVPGSSPASKIGFSPTLGFLPSLKRLNALLQINETSNDTRVIASPKTVVLNKKTASILQSSPVGIPVTTLGAAGAPVNSIQVLQANLSLNVTPTVTNTGSVLLTLDISRDTVEGTAEQPLVAPRNLKTEVLVDSGSTLVLGGVHVNSKNKSEYGIPFLKDIPLLGILFGGSSTTEKKTELLIFVTPRIINERASSIAGGESNGAPAGTPTG